MAIGQVRVGSTNSEGRGVLDLAKVVFFWRTGVLLTALARQALRLLDVVTGEPHN